MIDRICAHPKCDNKVLGKSNKKYCSKRCHDRAAELRWQKRNPDKRSSISRKSTTGFSAVEFNEKVQRQGGLCDVCSEPLIVRGMANYGSGKGPLTAVADHNAISGQRRGVIHRICNRGLGFFNNDPKRLLGAMYYMEKWEKCNTEPHSWIGVDLDGTLAVSVTKEWDGPIGAPIALMVARVREWLTQGKEVRIFTARVSPKHKDGSWQDPLGLVRMRERIGDWCEEHIGQRLESTCEKDHNVAQLWDDKAVQVVRDKGEQV